MNDLKHEAVSLGKDILIAFLIIGIILGSLYIYSSRWPPMVVIESSSMSHDDSTPPISQLGVVDTGDIVVVKDSGRDDIVTYLEGMAQGHRTYGQYGDVLIYRPMGSDRRTPIIHRSLMYLEYNNTGGKRSFDIPSLDKLEYDEVWETDQGEKSHGLNGTLTIHDYGYENVEVTIDLGRLIDYGHSGFITMGDNNFRGNTAHYDQGVGICPAPVKEDWIDGKARGELPWFGTLKLVYLGKTSMVPRNTWNNLMISIIVIIALPFMIDYSIDHLKKEENEKSDKMDEERAIEESTDSDEEAEETSLDDERKRKINEAVEDMVRNDDRLF